MTEYVNFLTMLCFAQHVALLNAHKLLEDDQEALTNACNALAAMRDFVEKVQQA